jgi:hypothetical protein
MVDTRSPEFNRALIQASEECGLQSYYRDCVRPLLMMPITQWPTCCGSNCEPCAQLLVIVASRICELLAIDPHELTST